jgi:hypothetical protein
MAIDGTHGTARLPSGGSIHHKKPSNPYADDDDSDSDGPNEDNDFENPAYTQYKATHAKLLNSPPSPDKPEQKSSSEICQDIELTGANIQHALGEWEKKRQKRKAEAQDDG